MCGIFCTIICDNNHDCLKPNVFNNDCTCADNIHKIFEDNLIRRGPDKCNNVNKKCLGYNIFLNGNVLWLQGEELTEQPVEISNSFLLFNGDIFGGKVVDEATRTKSGDTKPLLEALLKENIVDVLKNIQGPYSIIFIDTINNKIYFARDPYGRRSLLIGYNNGQLVLTSVAKRNSLLNFIELPAIGIFTIDITKPEINLELTPWNLNIKTTETIDTLEKHINLKITLQKPCFINDINISDLNIQNPTIPITENDPKKILNEISNLNEWSSRTTQLKIILQNAVHVRVSTQPKKYSDCVGILFSGGLDCTILSALAHNSLPESCAIHLFNVAFENPETGSYETPDRKTGHESLEELKRLYPSRNWVFFEINITRNELDTERSRRISDLIYPLTSILDESLGCAFWFAMRGSTQIQKSPCRIMLVGTGADELFGGYMRHRNALQRTGWEGLTQELAQDWYNLPYRNLARDDRVAADHQRQVRTPYLDENFVEYVRNLPAWDKCWPNRQFPAGLGDKLLLRLLAFKLGLEKTALFPKRALQFGCRIANKKENAKDISPRLL